MYIRCLNVGRKLALKLEKNGKLMRQIVTDHHIKLHQGYRLVRALERNIAFFSIYSTCLVFLLL